MLHSHSFGGGACVFAEGWFANVRVQRRATSAAHDLVQSMRAARVGVALDPMLEEMLVPGDEQSHMMLAKHRHPLRSQRESLRLDVCSTVRSGGEHRVMKKQRDVWISAAIEPRELRLDPVKLDLVVGNIRVEGDEKCITESERVCWISV